MRKHRLDASHLWTPRSCYLLLSAVALGLTESGWGAPPNDQCTGAITLTNGVPYRMSTIDATATGDPVPSCQLLFGAGVWFKFTPPQAGQVTVSLCGSSFDTVLAVYTGTCGGLTEIACNDDLGPSCPLALQSSVQFTGTAGTTYYVLGGGYGGSGGMLQATATFPAPPSIRITPLTLTFSNRAAAGELAAVAQPAPPAPTTQPGQKLTDPARILTPFTNGSRVAVIVNLTPPRAQQALTDFQSPASLTQLRATIRQLQQRVLDSLPTDQVKVGLRYDNIAAFSAEVTLGGLQALQAHPEVVAIEPVFRLQAHLAQGIPLIHGLTYRNAYAGSNIAIAICDTGIDYTHPRLGGGGFPNAKVLGGYDFGDNDTDPAPYSFQAHGTCCAGIAAGDLGTVGDYIGGVAYGAKLYALKISDITGFASDASMIAAWDWCVTHRLDDPANPILVISTSFGGDRYYDSPSCDAASPAMTAAANNAVAAGMTVLASSGNDGYCDSLAWPACISSVLSVGAVYDASFGTQYPCINSNSCAPTKEPGGCSTGYYATDETAPDLVTSYANMASFLTLLAPGDACYTTDIAGPGGYSSGDYDDTFGGTSAACPYAAGAVACLQSAAKALTGRYLSPAEVRTQLSAGGDPVTDTKVAITKPRVNLERTLNSVIGAQTFRIYNDGGDSLTINGITPETPAPWINLATSPPLTLNAGGYADVPLSVNYSLAPRGTTTTRLLVTSTDSTNSPYPGGVYIQVINGRGLFLDGWNWAGGVFRFEVHGPPNSNCVVQTSSDLASWVPLMTTPIPGSGLLAVTNSHATNSRLFYRALLP